jgi:hypothetical protein
MKPPLIATRVLRSIALVATTILGLSAHALGAPTPPQPTPVPAASNSSVPAPTLSKPIAGIAQVVLKWSKVSGASTYNVYAALSLSDLSKSHAPLQRGLTDTETIVPLALALDKDGKPQSVYFAVSAIASGEEGELSAPQMGKAQADAAPLDVTAKPGNTEVQLSWTSVGAGSYEIDFVNDINKRDETAVPGFGAVTGGSAEVKATVPDLQNGHTYYFIVKSHSFGSINAAESLIVSATPVAPTGTPATPKQPNTTPSVPAIDLTSSPCTDLPSFQTVAKQVTQANLGIPLSDSTLPVLTKNNYAIREIQTVLDEEKRALTAPGAEAKTTFKSELTNALTCNIWLANETAAVQQRSSSNSVQAFPKFSTSVANNSQLVSTHLVSAFMPAWLDGAQDYQETQGKSRSGSSLDPYTNSHFWNDIGFDISSAVPVSSATLADYATQELLARYGGLLNTYVSLSGRNYANEAYAWGNRSANLDRLYFLDLDSASEPATAKQALMFLSEGLGVKALKTSLSGSSSLGAQGTAYVGLGVDGPLFLAAQDNATAAQVSTGSPAGMASFEVYVSANAVTASAISELFTVTKPGTAYWSWGATLNLYVTNNVGIQVQYVAAQGTDLGRTIGHVAIVSLSYTQTSTAASAAQAASKASSVTSAPSSQ